jgi:hypothetical protein
LAILHSSFFILLPPLTASAQKPNDDIPPLAPPLPEIPPTLWEQFGWLLWILVPLLLVVAGFIVWLRLRPGKPPVLSAPDAQARDTLAALQTQAEDGATLRQISQSLRRYLINAFWLLPDEATTTEFCARLQSSERIGPELASALGEFLRQCDERKFSPAPAYAPLRAAQRALELVAQAELRRGEPRASVLECGGPPPRLPDVDESLERQRVGALQYTDANAKPPAP